MKTALLLVASTFVLGCFGATVSLSDARGGRDGTIEGMVSTSSETASTDDLFVTIDQPDTPPVFGGRTEMDVRYVVTVENRKSEPVTVKRITMNGIGGIYDVGSGTMPFNQAIAPRGKKSFDMWLRASNLNPRTGVSGPVSLRAEITMEVNGQEVREAFIRSTGSSGVSGVVTAEKH